MASKSQNSSESHRNDDELEEYKNRLSQKQHDILVHWQMFDHLSQDQIAEDLDTSQSYVSWTINNYGWLYEGDFGEGEVPPE